MSVSTHLRSLQGGVCGQTPATLMRRYGPLDVRPQAHKHMCKRAAYTSWLRVPDAVVAPCGLVCSVLATSPACTQHALCAAQMIGGAGGTWTHWSAAIWSAAIQHIGNGARGCRESRRRLQGDPRAAADAEASTGACGTTRTGQHLRVAAERWPDGTPAPTGRVESVSGQRLAWCAAGERARDGHTFEIGLGAAQRVDSEEGHQVPQHVLLAGRRPF